MTWLRKRKAKVSPAEAARQLRELALAALVHADAPAGASPLSGVILEIGLPAATATLVCLADDSTSLYFSSGGGVIGAGAHASVRRAAAEFLSVAACSVASFSPAPATPQPQAGEVRFYLAQGNALRTAVVAETELTAGGDPLCPLYAAGQAVITAIRESSPPQ